MALTVEDGTGLAAADSYLSVADADAYHTKFGNAAWTGVDGLKEVALRKATRYIDATFRGQWKGTAINSTMALAWPRTGAADEDGYQIDEDVVPDVVEQATAELALRALTEDIFPDIDEPGKVVTAESNTVGPLSTSVEYAASSSSQIKRYRLVDRLLSGLIGSTSEFVRA